MQHFSVSGAQKWHMKHIKWCTYGIKMVQNSINDSKKNEVNQIPANAEKIQHEKRRKMKITMSAHPCSETLEGILTSIVKK